MKGKERKKKNVPGMFFHLFSFSSIPPPLPLPPPRQEDLFFLAMGRERERDPSFLYTSSEGNFCLQEEDCSHALLVQSVPRSLILNKHVSQKMSKKGRLSEEISTNITLRQHVLRGIDVLKIFLMVH
jgi:hypothetical protein